MKFERTEFRKNAGISEMWIWEIGEMEPMSIEQLRGEPYKDSNRF